MKTFAIITCFFNTICNRIHSIGFDHKVVLVFRDNPLFEQRSLVASKLKDCLMLYHSAPIKIDAKAVFSQNAPMDHEMCDFSHEQIAKMLTQDFAAMMMLMKSGKSLKRPSASRLEAKGEK